jgi:hypothetical protein
MPGQEKPRVGISTQTLTSKVNELAGAAVRGSREGSALTGASNQGKGGGEVDGVEALLKVEEDLQRDRENKAALVQEILSSVIHYYATKRSKPSLT